MLLGFHVGDEVVHADEMFGHSASLGLLFHRTEDVKDALRGAGFGEVETIVRDPYPEEHPTRRG
ncbi:MAG TPA: hypothetical protein VHG93_28275 [Longimicrobium sp.]|nr:hypothetical protein [Longimicrobium sp.]